MGLIGLKPLTLRQLWWRLAPYSWRQAGDAVLITLAVSGYRSLRDVVVPLDRVTVVTGPNGTGKSSFYRALRLLSDVAQGRVIGSLAAEGGLPSTLWAGPEQVSRAMRQGRQPVQGSVRTDRVAVRLGFATEDYGYAVDLGLPQSGRTLFSRDPEIKAEAVWAGEALRRSNGFAARRGAVVSILDAEGKREVVVKNLDPTDSMMTHAADPRHAPELLDLRDRMRGWRFYDHFRTDRDAPARRAQIGSRTPVMASDGADLAAALQTIIEIGDAQGLAAAIDDAFPGSVVEVRAQGAQLDVVMHQHGMLRPLTMAELSDGTLRYLLLVAALLTPRPPELLVLNEPETSLHGDLLAPLGRLILAASAQAQVIVVSHAPVLVEALGAAQGALRLALDKDFGETVVADVDRPAWNWPKR